MNMSGAQIVNTMLYEGRGIYPYWAPSTRRPRECFTFGRLYPKAFSERKTGGEPYAMQAECLIKSRGGEARLKVTLGFLQPIMRNIGVFEKVLQRIPENAVLDFQEAPELEVGGKVFQAWMEARERKVSHRVEDVSRTESIGFAFPATESRETICNEEGRIAAVVLRRHAVLEGRLDIRLTRLQEGLFRVCARVVNLSAMDPPDLENPQMVLLRTFASAHLILEAESGEFISLLETPPEFKLFADECKNIGCWPVLARDEVAGGRTVMLASPIILHDYPKTLCDGGGEFFDGEMRGRPPANDSFAQPAASAQTVVVRGTELRPGDRVILRPRQRANIFNLIVAGRTAIIESIEAGMDGQVGVVVLLEGDPATGPEASRHLGHRLFYGGDEIEPLTLNMEAAA